MGARRLYFRSRWEANYARYLEWLKDHGQIAGWEHEPKTFWFPVKRGTVSYLPDFRIVNVDGTEYWVEVKGYMDAKSKTKLRRMAKHYPHEKIVLVDSNWYKRHNNIFSNLIPQWEVST